ncbi:cell envelope-related function transcriptional attenuator common domain-containing protein [Propionibacterium cyclohexanicum]|mgnify:CR=1 FL=1|uniref:Cell envelope-related function transcriptional attenuator common domain-containing protein n=1 Tax=Propionibacterium cyclohexanicum TaxID=64702 RepID=A0A1H9SZF7_9ACTN|nr:LCP family protein [Propionibacterium cyclohexanicum]SER89829.1 cell envelope-related function transcriptional attenuator common domain-containing protein [Propionibacterium cyclohexanicum]
MATRRTTRGSGDESEGSERPEHYVPRYARPAAETPDAGHHGSPQRALFSQAPFSQAPFSQTPPAGPDSAAANPGAEMPYDVEREGLREPPAPASVGSGARARSQAGQRGSGVRSGHEHPGGFGSTALRTTIGTLIPGTGLLGTRRTLAGLTIFLICLLGAMSVGLAAWLRPQILVGLVMSSTKFTVLGIALAIAAVLWVALVVGTYLTARPARMTRAQRIIGATLVFVMSVLVATPTGLGSAYSFTTGSVIADVFGNDNARSKTRPHITNEANPFADKERLNILLLGGDSGAGRDTELGLRTDTVILASIDTHTGNTVLIQLPRNLENVPFPPGSDLAKVYPHGRIWDGVTGSEDSYMLNAVWNEVPQEHPELFQDTDYKGADATKLAVSGITGLSVDYFVMINIDGIQKLVDAMGGVTVNVNFPIAKGGHVDGYGTEACGVDGHLNVGANQHLNGADAMWYARSRCNDPDYDYGRMRRQSCLINAVVKQANPQTMLTRYEAIASAGQNMMSTDIPENLLDDIADLALKVKDAQVTRVVFAQSLDGTPVANEIVPGNPDYPAMRAAITSAIDSSEGITPAPAPSTAAAGAQPSADPQPSVEQASALAPQPEASPSVAPQENLADVCSFTPAK